MLFGVKNYYSEIGNVSHVTSVMHIDKHSTVYTGYTLQKCLTFQACYQEHIYLQQTYEESQFHGPIAKECQIKVKRDFCMSFLCNVSHAT
jgi:hypothetical protein